MNKLAIIQARMSSSRLPGKVLMDIAAKPMLLHVAERAQRAKMVDQVVVATTTDPSDDTLARFCQEQGLACFRGSLPDVLDRYYQTARHYHAEVIIRLTADCPLIDPALLDLTVLAFLGQALSRHESGIQKLTEVDFASPPPFDFAANRLPPPWQRSLPIGLDVEVCSFDALERAWKQADQLYMQEHVMPYLYEGVVFPLVKQPVTGGWYLQTGTTPRGFKVVLLNHSPDYGSQRWTVDTPADLEFVRQVYAHFEGQVFFAWQQIIELLEREPALASINAEIKHKSAFDVDHRNSLS